MKEFTRRSLAALFAVALAPVASAGATVVRLPPLAGVPPSIAAWPTATKQFGVGMAAAAGVSPVPGKEICDGVLGTVSCPLETPGKRMYRWMDHEHGDLKFGSQSLGFADAKLTVGSFLGTANYSTTNTVDETKKLLQNVFAHTQADLNWDDTFYIKSTTLPKGSPVTLNVQLTVSPTKSNVACDVQQNSTGTLEFYSPNAIGPGGSVFEVGGVCRNGTFIYFLYGNENQPGTIATGTITTAVGNSLTIYGTMSLRSTACQPSNQCVGMIVSQLAGSYKFTVTSITSGATYTTASGNTYH